jgi:D-alanyl-D-alanine carboxypeptidase
LHYNKYPIIGSKTGYLDEAGFCLMTRLKAPSNKQLIIVSLGADDRETSFYETEELIAYALKKYGQ